MNAQASNGGSAAALLSDFVHEIEELEADKQLIAQQIKAKKAAAKAAGFEIKVINQIIKERRASEAERREFQALLEMYRAALGMLDGTPLGAAARKRLMGEPEPDPEPDAEGGEDGGGKAEAPAAPEPALDLEGARAAGRAAAREGKRIIDNPFLADDPRRAAWDEGWCAETGSDGMDIPASWRRKEKKKPKPGKPEGSEGPEGAGNGEGETDGEPEDEGAGNEGERKDEGK
ncbi:MAG: hypothetical protein Kow0032_07590 [Methyloligellaceae bacterium]